MRSPFFTEPPLEILQALLQRRALGLGLRQQARLLGESIAKLAFILLRCLLRLPEAYYPTRHHVPAKTRALLDFVASLVEEASDVG